MAEPQHITCPPELAGIAAQFDAIEGAAARAAVVAMLQQTMACCAAMSATAPAPPAPKLPPLKAEQQAVIDYLEKHGVTPADEIAQHAGYSQSTIYRWANGPLAEHGVKSCPNGLYLDSTA